MKILFVMRNTGLYERQGIMQLSSIVKQHGHSTKLLLTEDLSEEECVAELHEYEPQILAYTVMTGEHNYHIELNHTLKKHYNFLSVFGGPHPTYVPDMIEKVGVDAVCQGEGDLVFLDLVERMSAGKDYYDIPNFWFKKPNGDIVRNDIGPLIEDLDTLPFPDRELMYEVDPALAAKGDKQFMAMRGCPYLCTYCFNHTYNKMMKGLGKIYKSRSVDLMVEEINQVREKYRVDLVDFCDDTFLARRFEWLEEASVKFPREVGLPIRVNLRADLLSKEKYSEVLRKMGVKVVVMAAECGNNEVATKILKRNMSNEAILEASRNLRKNKIRLISQNLIGLPVDNPLEVDFETLDFNIQIKPFFAWSSILYPYPQTEIGQLAVDKGLFEAEYDNIQVSNKTSTSLDFGDEMLKRRLVNLHKLFPIIVQFPVLRPLTMFMISLPLEKIYTWLFFAFYGIKMVFQTRFSTMVKTSGHYLKFFIKYVSRLESRRLFTKKKPSKLFYPKRPSARSSNSSAKC